jgi:general secretion pathway protein D
MLGPVLVETQSSAGAPVAKPSADARRSEATVKAVPIERWLATLADEAGVGLVLAPGVAGSSVAATFSPDVDWQRRLDAVARLYALDVQLEDGLLEVASREPEPPAGAVVPVLVGESTLASSLVVGSAAIEAAPKPRHITRLLRLSNARASDLVRALDGPLRAGGITAGFDPATNALVLGGPEGEINSAVDLAQQLDIPRRRFLLEAHIVELSRSARQEMGVQWTLESGDLGGIVDFPAAATEGEGGGIVVATSGTHTLRARLSALESEGRVRVISRPRIVVVEGKPASIEAVRILRVRLPDRGAVVAESDSTVALGVGRAFEEIRVGVRLEVEPALHGEGNVVLRIIAKSSTLGPPQPPDGIPEELSRRVEAEVVVADRHTAVLGGLLREGSARSGAGIPVLRSLPLLGALFGRRSRERDVEELIVLVTPRLIS